MAHYLVTGGCGFIGAHLVTALRDGGHQVSVLDNLSTGRRDAIPASVTLHQTEVSDGAAVKQAFDGIDGCFHLAGDPSVPRCIEDYLGSHLTNQTGTVAVLDAAAKEGAKRNTTIPVVYASSCAVYGMPKHAPLREDAPTLPVNGYGVDKLGGEGHARIAEKLFGVPNVGLRYFNVFGPGQNPDSPYSGVLSIFCRELSNGRSVTIHGDGSQVRDFIYVGDIVARTVSAMTLAAKGGCHVLNVCTGHKTTILEAAETIAALCGTAFKPHFTSPREGDVSISLGDPAACNAALGPLSTTPIKDGLRQTLDWLSSRPSTSS